MSSASRASAGAVAPTWVTSLPGLVAAGGGSRPGEGRLLGSEFDSTARLGHFQEETRRSKKLVRMSEMRLVMLLRDWGMRRPEDTDWACGSGAGRLPGPFASGPPRSGPGSAAAERPWVSRRGAALGQPPRSGPGSPAAERP